MVFVKEYKLHSKSMLIRKRDKSSFVENLTDVTDVGRQL
jgi:hypothetical protein